MMLRQDLVRCVVIAAAGLALTGCGGGLAATEAPARAVRAEERRAEAAAAAEKRGHDDRRPESREERALQARAEVEASADAGALAAEAPYHVSPERARAIDLEWNQELPQPPQDQVVAPPPAWKPAAQAEVAAAPEISDVWPNKGPEAGGDVVVIKGRNLGASQVLFGMAPARIIEASADALKVAAPGAGAGEVAVVVTNADGAYAIAAHAFRYYR